MRKVDKVVLLCLVYLDKEGAKTMIIREVQNVHRCK